MMTSPSMPTSTWRMASLSKSSAVLLSALLLFTPVCFHPSAPTQARPPFAVFQSSCLHLTCALSLVFNCVFLMGVQIAANSNILGRNTIHLDMCAKC